MSSSGQPGKSILLVEDDELIRGAMKMVLEWEGYEVVCAGNGREALDYLHAAPPPAVIVLDLMMPEVNGWEFRQAQERDPALAGIPVVVVSGVEVADSLNASGYVHKPFEVHELLETIRHQA